MKGRDGQRPNKGGDVGRGWEEPTHAGREAQRGQRQPRLWTLLVGKESGVSVPSKLPFLALWFSGMRGGARTERR